MRYLGGLGGGGVQVRNQGGPKAAKDQITHLRVRSFWDFFGIIWSVFFVKNMRFGRLGPLGDGVWHRGGKKERFRAKN